MKRKSTNLPTVSNIERMHDHVLFGTESMAKFLGNQFDLKKSLDEIEESVIDIAITRFQNQSRTAEFLGMTEQCLRYRMKVLGIKSLGRKKPMKLSQAGEA